MNRSDRIVSEPASYLSVSPVARDVQQLHDSRSETGLRS